MRIYESYDRQYHEVMVIHPLNYSNNKAESYANCHQLSSNLWLHTEVSAICPCVSCHHNYTNDCWSNSVLDITGASSEPSSTPHWQCSTCSSWNSTQPDSTGWTWCDSAFRIFPSGCSSGSKSVSPFLRKCCCCPPETWFSWVTILLPHLHLHFLRIFLQVRKDFFKVSFFVCLLVFDLPTQIHNRNHGRRCLVWQTLLQLQSLDADMCLGLIWSHREIGTQGNNQERTEDDSGNCSQDTD